jgi:hypothetical protein
MPKLYFFKLFGIPYFWLIINFKTRQFDNIEQDSSK